MSAICTTTPPPSALSNNSNLIQFASTFSQFPPNSQNQALSLINNTPTTTLPSKILFSTLHELPGLSSSTNFSYDIYPFIITLAKNKVHIPLTLFSSNSTRKLHTKATSLKHNTVYNAAGLKCHILDLSQFPDESKINIADWHKIHDLPGHTLWKEHYLFLCVHNDFCINFSAILLFNIAE
ncbi:hypothetical protein L208DRAFT_1472460 [Tricholoma matsutake]|nr:hypothetical protein L208DRAFT_1472460 [Tricholoma matsutake 945]